MMRTHNLTDLGSLPNLKLNKTKGLFQIPEMGTHLKQNLENLDFSQQDQSPSCIPRTENKRPIPKGIGSHSAGGFHPFVMGSRARINPTGGNHV